MIFSSIAWGIKKPFQLVGASWISQPMGFIENNLRRIELIGLLGLAVGLMLNPPLFMGGVAAAWQGIGASVGNGWSIIPAAFNACANVIAMGYHGLAAGAGALWTNVLAPAFNGAAVSGTVLQQVSTTSGASIAATTASITPVATNVAMVGGGFGGNAAIATTNAALQVASIPVADPNTLEYMCQIAQSRCMSV